VSFQITILKVLAGHPDGRASISELTRYVSILMTSGSDFTDRMRQLAARAPKLEIFGDRFVLRDGRGWCITESGRQFVASLEAPIPARAEHQASEAAAEPNQVQPTLRLIVDNTRTSPSGLGPDETRRSAWLYADMTVDTVFDHPKHVLVDSSLSTSEKRAILA
jgi:hypothetical protein